MRKGLKAADTRARCVRGRCVNKPYIDGLCRAHQPHDKQDHDHAMALVRRWQVLGIPLAGTDTQLMVRDLAGLLRRARTEG